MLTPVLTCRHHGHGDVGDVLADWCGPPVPLFPPSLHAHAHCMPPPLLSSIAHAITPQPQSMDVSLWLRSPEPLQPSARCICPGICPDRLCFLIWIPLYTVLLMDHGEIMRLVLSCPVSCASR